MFLNKAKLQFEYEDKDNIKWYTLKEPLIFSSDDEEFIIPVLFKTDLASVPYGLQWLFKPNGKYTRSAILHDYMYSLRTLKRSYCDKIFLKAMKSDGVNFMTRWLFYFAVRCFGWWYR